MWNKYKDGKKHLYHYLSNDEFEYPLYVAESKKELSDLTGFDLGYICRALKNPLSRFKDIIIDEEGEQE